MNKLAILAFALLLFFSTMLWYLANGSLNEYLKSQIELQGHYYSGQTTTLELADFSANTRTVIFKQLNLHNLNNYKAQYVLTIDEAKVELFANQQQHLLTKITNITINKLTLNIEQKVDGNSNIAQISEIISVKLANDYPELYPAISAKIYAEKNPALNADKYVKNPPQAGQIIAHKKQNKKRGKAQQKITISAINIKTLELNTTQGGVTNSIQKHNVNISTLGGTEGFISNQIGGEVLLKLLNLANQ